MSSILYEEIQTAFKFAPKPEIPKSISANLKQMLRPYQVKALENFIFYNENQAYQNIKNKHLLFHMATGSGKTNIIASTILYLYEQGYRNFIFFVNTTNIITKTKQNLANKYAYKYLFTEQIVINDKKVEINVIEDSFENSKADDINIMFTTVQKLHSDLFTTVKENSITYADFEDKKIVLIADEAHHLNSNKKKNSDAQKEASWGNTVETLLKTNKENILLEFTATAEVQSHADIAKHYHDKTIFNYAFPEFRADGYSKEVALIQSGFDEKFRILQAIMISEYRQIVAENEALNFALKPIVMFKNPKGIKHIDKNLEAFNQLIERLSVKDIDEVFSLSEVDAIKELKTHIKENVEQFVTRLQFSFAPNKCVKIYSTSADKEATLELLNNLEDEHNPIRVIFAVNVLNEGWDVLNLFDIVKLDEATKNPASTTSEAQLIGRGARYNPFSYGEEDRYKRKFDSDLNNPFRMMETMYFHSVNQNDYIQKLKTTLTNMGIFDPKEEEQTVTLRLKESFENHDLYKEGVVYVNAKKRIDKKKIINGINHYMASYKHQTHHVDQSSREIKFLDDTVEEIKYKAPMIYKLSDFNPDIARVAINKKPFFYFANLKRYFPNLKSIKAFIADEDYLGGVAFSIQSTADYEPSDNDKLFFISKLLEEIESSVIKNSQEFEATQEFFPVRISSKIPKEKILKLKSDSKIEIDEDWYVFEGHGGTSEEKFFVGFFYSMMGSLKEKYQDIKLIRNEKAFNIHSLSKNRNADKFEPDFVLLLQDKEQCYHQIFIEPKGDHLLELDKWKNDFLLDISELTKNNKMTLASVNKKDELIRYENRCYKIYGLPFYNKTLEDDFKQKFKSLVMTLSEVH
ncbi:DEAD/DEAH box helicase family protein [bacterium]|nr:DEAD/DEAH box helicase family protein [bacterium]MBU1958387.1 DEAD/DEAH box helicase family protein [bacterium]